MDYNMLNYGDASFVPQADPQYCKTEYFDDLQKILNRNIFFPVMISGPTGVAKTMTVEEVCSSLNRELFRVNITIESDEDSLMGGFRLKNGDTVFDKGPVIRAMERGAILLLDEIDLGSPSKMMCLQSILEGKGYLIKRTGEYVRPAAGFNIIGTCNTKGQGDESGLFNATQILNEAMLDRFHIMFEAKFPNEDDEKKILMGYVDKFSINDDKIEEHVDILVKFANNVRDTIEKTNDMDHNISTRRLVGIIEG